MEPQFIKANFDIDFDWTTENPTYRIYVNDELFTERTYIYGEEYYLSEMLQIRAVPGCYTIRVEYLNPESGTMRIINRRVEFGPGRWLNDNEIEITDAS